VELLNRTAVIVTPKRRFLEWVNRLPDAGKPLTIEDAGSLRIVYLAATGYDTPEASEIIDTYYEELFEDSLHGWTDDESLWPPNRTSHVFRDWFHVDCIDGVADADPSEPLTIRELARTRCAACETELDSGAIAVITFSDRRTGRITIQELDLLNEQGTKTDDGNLPVLAFRCCSETCAQRIEEDLTEARNSENSNRSDRSGGNHR
jgi:hypothetical protein